MHGGKVVISEKTANIAAVATIGDALGKSYGGYREEPLYRLVSRLLEDNFGRDNASFRQIAITFAIISA